MSHEGHVKKGEFDFEKVVKALESTKLDNLYAERLIAAAIGDLKKLELISIKVEAELEHLELERYEETKI
jgi:hypothetical protein